MSFIEETQSEVNLCQKKNPYITESITVKSEMDDFDNRKTTNDVDQDLDQKSTIKSEQENSTESQFLISHEEVDIKSEDNVEQSDTQISAVEKEKYRQINKKVAAHSTKPNTAVELFKLKLKLKLKMLFDSNKNLLDKAFINKKRETPTERPRESITLKIEPDDFENSIMEQLAQNGPKMELACFGSSPMISESYRKTEIEVDRDLDQKSTIQIHSHVKTEEEDFINSEYLISHEEVNIKLEDDVEQSDTQISAQPNKTVELNKCNSCGYLKNNMISPRCPDSVEKFECSSCFYKSAEEKRLKNHKVGHQPKDQIIHKCPDCSYQSKYKWNVKKHSIRHRKPNEIVWHRCTECPYKSQRKDSLKVHAIVHNETWQNEIFKCAHCVFETPWKTNLKHHLLAHRGGNVPWIYCPESECPYKTHDNTNLKRHRSRAHSNDQFFKCSQCPYQAKRQEHLKTHQLKHESSDKWHSCPQCPFKTIHKCILKKHAFTHNMDHAKWLQCASCSFKTRGKSDFKRHQTRHQGPSWHKCPECPYKAPQKFHLQRHAKNHKAADQTDWLQCPECSYRTSRTNHLKTHQMLHRLPIKNELEALLSDPCENMHQQAGHDESTLGTIKLTETFPKCE